MASRLKRILDRIFGVPKRGFSRITPDGRVLVDVSRLYWHLEKLKENRNG